MRTEPYPPEQRFQTAKGVRTEPCPPEQRFQAAKVARSNYKSGSPNVMYTRDNDSRHTHNGTHDAAVMLVMNWRL